MRLVNQTRELDRTVTLPQLRTFRTVADQLSFSAAASELNLRAGGRGVEGFPVRRQWHVVRLRRRRLPSSVQGFVELLTAGGWQQR
jgi:DNA-binding transcriptional LysR family regulator